jgi:hypothetical protein
MRNLNVTVWLLGLVVMSWLLLSPFLYAQTAPSGAIANPAPSTPISEPGSGKTLVGVGMLFGYVVQWAKKSKYVPWLDAQSKKLTLMVQLGLSGLSALGITMTWNREAHTVLIAGLSLATVFSGAWHWFFQFAVQHGWTNLLAIAEFAEANLPNVKVTLPSAPAVKPAPG